MDFSPCGAPSALDRGDVHVWTATLDERASVLSRLEMTLSPSEKNKADRFRLETHRSRYIFARAVLRDTLARYVGLKPERLEFQLSQFGKPYLPENDAGRAPFFNVSHSESLVVIAITADRPVGVDVEWIRPMHDIDSIAQHWFAPQERAWVQAAPLTEKERVFYTCWTRKEAYIKARGMGLSIPLRSFDTSSAPGFVRRTLESADASCTDRWEITDLPLPGGFVGALAVESGVRQCMLVTSPLNSTRWDV